jgi:catechol 2,3-dioxygenase-like lactoylglutathione lyase family enzyme
MAVTVTALTAVGLVTPHAERTARFFEGALGFARLATARRDDAPFEDQMEVAGGALIVTLGLGEQRLELVQFDRPGAPYPPDVRGDDPRFQHIAIVVSDMAAAYARLEVEADWTPISAGGPVRLPAATGGVTAFKFRDADGHPLELLAFPDDAIRAPWRSASGLFLGMDHSAISVADVARSTVFYEALGLGVTGRSHNSGAEQAHLDGMAGATAEVIALSPPVATPHVELLGYATARQVPAVGPTDVAATRLVFAGSRRAALQDPDGHRLVIETR